MSHMKKLLGILLMTALVSGTAVASDDAVQTRIAPVGGTCMQGDECAAAPAPAAAAGPKSGKDYSVKKVISIFNQSLDVGIYNRFH